MPASQPASLSHPHLPLISGICQVCLFQVFPKNGMCSPQLQLPHCTAALRRQVWDWEASERCVWKGKHTSPRRTGPQNPRFCPRTHGSVRAFPHTSAGSANIFTTSSSASEVSRNNIQPCAGCPGSQEKPVGHSTHKRAPPLTCLPSPTKQQGPHSLGSWELSSC